ncbi:hypothetical protein HQ576_03810, partial [bacterium]|nr:hypothetical protein [bacterium]
MATKQTAAAKPLPIYNGRPLTIELWAKVASRHGFQILVANEPKASAT